MAHHTSARNHRPRFPTRDYAETSPSFAPTGLPAAGLGYISARCSWQHSYSASTFLPECVRPPTTDSRGPYVGCTAPRALATAAVHLAAWVVICAARPAGTDRDAI